jgi:hypothetical protein
MEIFPTILLPPEFIWDSDVQSNGETSNLTAKVWPRYLIEKSDIEEPQEPTSLSDEELSKRFRLWGIRQKSDSKLVAFASAVLISVDPNAVSYPYDGWRFAFNSYYRGGEVNCLCLMSANVDPEFRSLKFSSALIRAAKEIAKSLNLSCVLAPVRPTQKSQFPTMLIAEYVEMKTIQGEIYDPWLRTHYKLGGEVLNICSESVLVKASLKKWQEWLGTTDLSSPFVPELGLVPLIVDQQKNIGIYAEPNIWIRYKISLEQ